MRNLAMSKSDRGLITAYRLRQDLGIAPFTPVDLMNITERLTIKVTHKELGKGIEGACKSKGAKRLVVLNPHPSSIQKGRFTLAHEIGHLLIHHSSYLCKSDVFRTYISQNDEEQEANDFAAELLLPKRAVLDTLDKSDLTFSAIEQISKQFDISLSVAAIRLTQLFQENAALIWHDGERVLWKVRSETCYLKIAGVISVAALAHQTNDSKWDINGNIDPIYWLENEVENLICEEETHYFYKLKKYLTILKFYFDY